MKTSNKSMKLFLDHMGAKPPVSQASIERINSTLTNWVQVHSVLSTLSPDKKSLELLLNLIYVECHRTNGPRAHILDRLYMRFSNLRREIETTLMSRCVPVEETEEG